MGRASISIVDNEHRYRIGHEVIASATWGALLPKADLVRPLLAQDGPDAL
jgi:hypothetical protein